MSEEYSLLEAQCRLSYYRPVIPLNEEHRVVLVRHAESGELFVRKETNVYDRRVYEILSRNAFPGIPRIAELIFLEDRLVIIEEYVNGRTLRSLLEEGPVTEPAAAGLLLRLCEILGPLHLLDPPLIHRDIKPENIMLDRDGRMMLLDFNAAKLYRSGDGRDTVLMGTPDYAAPEQYGFGSSGPETDIYAMGVVLSEMLTGSLPREARPSGKLAAIAEKCTRLDPRDRFASLEELKTALRKAVASTSAPSPAPAVSGIETAALAAGIAAGITAAEVGTASVRIETDDTAAGTGAAGQPRKPAKRAVSREEVPPEDGGSPRQPAPQGWRSFLPPGFRRGKFWHILPAVLFYPLLIYLACTDNTALTPVCNLVMMPIRVVLWLSIVLLWGNYRNLWSVLPMPRKKLPRFFCLLLWTLVPLIAEILLAMILFILGTM